MLVLSENPSSVCFNSLIKTASYLCPVACSCGDCKQECGSRHTQTRIKSNRQKAPLVNAKYHHCLLLPMPCRKAAAAPAAFILPGFPKPLKLAANADLDRCNRYERRASCWPRSQHLSSVFQCKVVDIFLPLSFPFLLYAANRQL